MKYLKPSLIINSIIVILVTIATIFMFTGFKFMPDGMLLEATKMNMFRFYTVDSNILVGVVSLLVIIFEIKLMKGKIEEIPKWVYNLKLMGVAGITLTFVVTLVFLAPLYGFYAMYNNSNLFYHLIIPILSLISYICFENYENKYRYALIGMIPMFIYSVYYTTEVLLHLENGKPTWEYDFYGFLQGNVMNIFITIPIIFAGTYVLSLIIVILNKKVLNK